jgi:hypothetical protein
MVKFIVVIILLYISQVHCKSMTKTTTILNLYGLPAKLNNLLDLRLLQSILPR